MRIAAAQWKSFAITTAEKKKYLTAAMMTVMTIGEDKDMVFLNFNF